MSHSDRHGSRSGWKPSRKIVILGSINQDLVIRCDRCPDAGETRTAQGLEFLPGGKGANQAVAARLYAGDDSVAPQVAMIGKVGSDPFGTALIDYLRSRHLSLHVEIDGQSPTGTALIVVENSGENRIMIVPGANATIQTADLGPIEAMSEHDLLVVQNEINLDATQQALQMAGGRGVRRVFNAAPALPLTKELLHEMELLVVNETEYAIGFGGSLDLQHLLPQLQRRRATLPCDLLVTLGERGAVYLQEDRIVRVTGLHVQPVDTTGAGDCFVGAFVARLARGDSPDEAMDFANRAAGLSITRHGASVSYPSLEEIDNSTLMR